MAVGLLLTSLSSKPYPIPKHIMKCLKFQNSTIHRNSVFATIDNTMGLLKPFKNHLHLIFAPSQLHQQQVKRVVMVGCQSGEKRKGFLSMEEAGLVEISGLSTHERFLCRLTISSLNLLRVISEQEGVPIEELNAGRVCDWFLKDKLKREQNMDSAVLQWDDSDFPI